MKHASISIFITHLENDEHIFVHTPGGPLSPMPSPSSCVNSRMERASTDQEIRKIMEDMNHQESPC
jgi:hypothetical protein